MMKAMILAAGLGTRLEPLTKIRPKPLFPVLNRPLLDITIEQIQRMGARGIIINAHHLAEQVERFVSERQWGAEVEVRVEPEILGTGGGIKNCADFLHDVPFFLVVNADIYHTFDLGPVLHYHTEAKNLATLVLCDYPRFNQVEIDHKGRIVSIRGESIKPSTAATQVLTFTGIHIISPEILNFMPSTGFFGIMELYMELVSQGKSIRGYHMNDGYWRDIGSVEAYKALHQDFVGEQGEPVVHPEAYVEETVRMEGVVCIGKGSRIGAGSRIKDSIIWDRVLIEKGSSIEGCVVADGTQVKEAHQGEVLIPR
ncbi:MAG: NTP transferase domain-containing protein [Deltaproteobacteria bacterium]|nr:NTP transferase domain-containing protein [Deltaproteobacteria bacterium]